MKPVDIFTKLYEQAFAPNSLAAAGETHENGRKVLIVVATDKVAQELALLIADHFPQARRSEGAGGSYSGKTRLGAPADSVTPTVPHRRRDFGLDDPEDT